MKKYNEILNSITPVNEEIMKDTASKLDNLVKPIGSLGLLEELAIQISGIISKIPISLPKKCVVIMASDNGICEENVAACPQSVTAMQTINFTKNITGINVLSNFAKSDIRIVDIGINDNLNSELIINRKIKYGTNNFLKEEAMSKEEVIKAINVGIEIVQSLVNEGYSLLGTGEMGIGNTTTSSAIVMSLLNKSADEAVGKGAGIDETTFINKKSVITKALDFHKPNKSDPIDVLAKVGGLDIAGLVGCYLAAASNKIPIVIDGFISATAALVASKLHPLSTNYMIASHISAEPGYKLIMDELKLKPMLNLNMRLGEGSGCPLAFNIIDAALEILNKMGTFADAMIEKDTLVDIR